MFEREKEVIEKCMYAEVRVETPSAAGSGTIIHTCPAHDEEDMVDTYIITNEHVVSDLIEIKKKWNSTLKREVKEDVLGHPRVYVFKYTHTSRAQGGENYQADIMDYDKDQDLALLRVRYEEAIGKAVAKLLPEAYIKRLMATTSVMTIGCPLANSPVQTKGSIASFTEEIDNREYWLCTAMSYFGNSGGGTFLYETSEPELDYCFVGIPARVSIKQIGWSIDVVPHLGFIIPVSRVYEFLRDKIFDFIIDPQRTPTECEADREHKRQQDLLRRIEAEPEFTGTVNPRGADSQHRYYDD